MCIICNCGDPDGYLYKKYQSIQAIKEAKKAMLSCSKNVNYEFLGKEYGEKVAKNYDRIHKKMKKIIKEWSDLDIEREVYEK